MRPRAKLVRVGLSFLYFIISFGTLFFFTGDSPGWLQANSQGRVMTIARLALACTVWDAVSYTHLDVYKRQVPYGTG